MGKTFTKLSIDAVKEILADTTTSNSDLAKRYNVCAQTINSIHTRRTYKHLGDKRVSNIDRPSGSRKLTADQVIYIRKNRNLTNDQLADQFNSNPAYIRELRRNNEIWKEAGIEYVIKTQAPQVTHLTADQVLDIYHDRVSPRWALAQKYKVSKGYVKDIQLGLKCTRVTKHQRNVNA